MDLVARTVKIIFLLDEKKKKLITIALEDDDSQTKLQKFRRALLEMQLNSEVQKEIAEIVQSLQIEQDVERITQMISIMEASLKRASILIVIGDIIRSNVGDDVKIENIINVLI